MRNREAVTKTDDEGLDEDWHEELTSSSFTFGLGMTILELWPTMSQKEKDT